MQKIEIYRNNSLVVAIKPDDNSSQTKKVMGANELSIAFKLSFYVNFRINDHCDAFGERYKINKLPAVIKRSIYLYEYTLTMEAEGFDLGKVQYLFLGPFNTLKEGDFSLMGNAETFIDLIIENAERGVGGWIKGQIIPTAYKNLTFKSINCYNALAQIATAFSTEFSIEGKTIHLTQRSRDTGVTMRHGRYKGLYDITRQNVDSSNIITRIYAFGSERNIPPDYKDGLSKRLKMPTKVIPSYYDSFGVLHPPSLDPGDYIELHTGDYGVIESTQIFDDIYPHRTGKVTSVNVSNPLKFYDTTIDFNVNTQMIPGISAKVVFNTGQLAGYTFDIQEGGFNNTTKEFTILKNQSEQSIDVPSVDLKPAIGDLYVMVDIYMPGSYIQAAERALKNKAIELLAVASEPQLQYSVNPDPTFLRRKNLTLNIGDLIWISDPELEIQRQIRITSVIRNIVNEWTYTIELSDVISIGPITLLQNATNNQGSQLGVINQQINTLAEKNLGDLPIINTTAGYSQVYINNTTGALRKYVP